MSVPSTPRDDHSNNSPVQTPGTTPTTTRPPPATNRPQTQAASYFTLPASPGHRRPTFAQTARTMSVTSNRPRPLRSTSVTSSHGTHRALREADDDGSSSSSSSSDSTDNPRRLRRSLSRTDLNGNGEEEEEEVEEEEEEPVTVKERQSLINVEHPFGLPIWKPALYKKSRSVTRYADEALHSVPSAQAERHLLPGNIVWAILFGWWLALICLLAAAILYIIPYGGKRFSTLVFGLGWYIFWPFGKYVEGDIDGLYTLEDEEQPLRSDSDGHPITTVSEEDEPASSNHSTITPRTAGPPPSSSSATEETSLLGQSTQRPSFTPVKSYGATPHQSIHTYSIGVSRGKSTSDLLGRVCFWLLLVTLIAPLLLIVCTICWAFIFFIPMAKLNWQLIEYLFKHPTEIRFCAAPAIVPLLPDGTTATTGTNGDDGPVQAPPLKRTPRLSEGQEAPSGSSTVLLCTYRAFGWKYYKYTVGGVNIMFINLLALVVFVLIDGFVLMRIAESRERAGKHVPPVLAFLTSRTLVFLASLLSVIPLSYFIGMAVASISAQSSIGMGAVINATFGSVIEIILYSIALTQHKGRLVEGSIIGSLLAGVLLMPGLSMCSGALRKKEQKFNAKSAGVTSMLLIMAFIGTLAPTLFYQTYGSFQLICSGCPSDAPEGEHPWVCDHCYYRHPDPLHDPFYQSTVKPFLFLCVVILLLSYLIGLWFSLRTHASQIWQNPRQLMQSMEVPMDASGSGHRTSLRHFATSGHRSSSHHAHSLRHRPSTINSRDPSMDPSRSPTPTPRPAEVPGPILSTSQPLPADPSARRVSYANPPLPPSSVPYTPLLESVNEAIKDTGIQPPQNYNTEEFTRAVAVATVSALRHQQNQALSHRLRASSGVGLPEVEDPAAGHGDHSHGASWSRTVSAAVLLACTVAYAFIAELLVDVVDVVLEGSGIDEKFLGITLFALVPNTTEFMNAMAFAMHGNIALSMEIGSAYALQVCLLQIPAMVFFSVIYAPDRMGSVADTFTLIFPRWDVIVVILSVFLMTYTWIEAKSNYHRGSILILSYIVLASAFYFAPPRGEDDSIPSVVPNFFQFLTHIV